EMHGLRHKRLFSRPSSTGGTSQRATADSGNSQRSNANRADSQRVNADDVNSQRSNANPADSQRVSADCVNSQRSSANHVNQRVGAVGVGSQMSSGEEDSNDGAIAAAEVSVDPPKRGRKKGSTTKLRVAPSAGKVQLQPKGSMQFSYVNYNPSDYKYGSQVGCIIKRCYPGIIKVYNDEGRIVAKRAALSWNDYTWGKHETGLSHAKLVKHEFWSLFTVSRQHRRKADCNLDSYLRKRVSDMLHQARLDAVKKHEKYDDTRARTILLTEAEYIKCKAEWCSVAAWKWLAHYWTTDEFLGKRKRAQEARLKSEEDVAQNRGGSRLFAETQQFPEYNFGSEKAGTINTYGVIKSGIKNADSSGNSAPIPSQKARRRLEDYKLGVGPDDSSKELDGKVLYFMEGDLRHGRVPIGNGVVDKAEVLAAAKSKHVQQSNTAAYRSVVEENELLRERNESLLEENGVNRELILTFYADFGKEPPTHLLDRLARIDAGRHQVRIMNASWTWTSRPDDMHNTDNDSDESNDESNDDLHSADGRGNGMHGEEG
ncbi:hypothetical protein EJB05_28602, partial [Eragrostis curvula]